MIVGKVDEGCIINISSVSRDGLRPEQLLGRQAAVTALAEGWAKELARYNIRTGAIGLVHHRHRDAGHEARGSREAGAGVPLKRLGEPIHRAGGTFMENDYFTGRCIDVDGGLPD